MSSPGAAWMSWVEQWGREQVQGKKKKKSTQNFLLATPISAPVPTRTTNEASRSEWFGWGRGLGGFEPSLAPTPPKIPRSALPPSDVKADGKCISSWDPGWGWD